MSVHVCFSDGEYHLRYPGMSQEEAQELADRINAGGLLDPNQQPPSTECEDVTLRIPKQALDTLTALAEVSGQPLPAVLSVVLAMRVTNLSREDPREPHPWHRDPGLEGERAAE